jgi:beta-lactamase class A
MKLPRLSSPLTIGAAMLLLGVGVGYAGSQFLGQGEMSGVEMTRQGGYQFINPLIACDFSEDTPYSGYGSLQRILQQEADALVQQGDATRISVYFRNMDSGHWTGVRPADNFTPASLMKVPLMIAYFNMTRTDPNALDKTYALPAQSDKNGSEYFKPSHPLPLGQTYTVQELIDAMIKYSDNNAEDLLNTQVPQSALSDVYFNFGVAPTPDQTSDNTSSIDYMRFFRILYNATYLGRARSQQALQTLSQTDFNDGLVAGVPAGTVVSHKFGERTVNIENPSTGAVTLGKRELHDCGIVYYSGSPYGICVMTEGTDFTKLAAAIAELSKTTYQAVQGGTLKN